MELVQKDTVFKARADYSRSKHILESGGSCVASCPVTGEGLAHPPLASPGFWSGHLAPPCHWPEGKSGPRP